MTQPIALRAPADSSKKQRDHSSQRALRKVTGEPFQIPSSIKHLIDPGLEEKNREERGNHELKCEDCTVG